ncbi:MAG: pitrilysin family protein [Methylotenera sp.]|nr:pitrilysin family protein [Methylotenera sp.]MDP1958752.1 pitrilysin family protein [Methylotenera sp.]MDP3206813.1 pitrilysin family protein [Methylotenera sp.]MDP3304169.1 pitrilysin family protein [Methylotenera sp.]MDP3944078.1 pitrilysin family protein [Methylotenera sp.]
MNLNHIKKILVLNLTLLVFSVSAHAGVKIQQWQTSSGAEVYFVENHDLPIVDVSVNFNAGSARDTAAKSGVAGVTRYLMTLGAAGMTDETIANKMADVGAILSGSFDADRAAFKLRTLSSEREKTQALEVFTKVLQQPDFPEAVLAREKARIISSLQESATQPESISNKAFMEALYGNHPYSLDESGEVDTVATIKREDLQSFYDQFYGAKGAVVAIIGDLTREQANAIAENITGGLPKAALTQPIKVVTPSTQAVERRITHPASQSHILLGYTGIKRGDPDLFPLYVGNYILGGGGFVSRLTEEVREKRGLVYSVYSYFMPMAELGPFQIGLQTKKDQADDALKLVRETLDNFTKKGVTEKELKAAKDNIIGGFPMRIDSNGKILDYLATIGFYKLPLSYLDDYNAKVASVTTAQIKDAFNRRLKSEHFVTVIVGAPEAK